MKILNSDTKFSKTNQHYHKTFHLKHKNLIKNPRLELELIKKFLQFFMSQTSPHEVSM